MKVNVSLKCCEQSLWDKEMAKVSIIKATYSDPGIGTLLAPLGGMEQFVKKNEKVLLKVNLLSTKKPPRKSPVITDKCTACGNCESICPKDAVKVQGQMAEVTYSKCIRCFCCHEVCPEDAIMLRSVKLN